MHIVDLRKKAEKYKQIEKLINSINVRLEQEIYLIKSIDNRDKKLTIIMKNLYGN